MPPQFVLDVISKGQKLPSIRVPDPCFIRNKFRPSFVEEAISKPLVADCIEEHFELLNCVNPLSVAEGKKLRLVIDLGHVNPCLLKHSFNWYGDLHSSPNFF